MKKQNKKPLSPIDEAEKIQQDILMREVEEEIQRERLLNLWKKYRFFVIGTIIAIIGVTAGTELYHSWYTKVRLAESDQFEQAVILNYTGKTEEANAIYSNLARNAHTGYAYLSELRLAVQAFDGGDTSAGLAHLQKVIDNKKAPKELRQVALLSAVGHQADTAEPTALLKTLEPLLSETTQPFYPSAVELQAVLLARAGQTGAAIKALNAAIALPNLAADAKDRLTALLTILSAE